MANNVANLITPVPPGISWTAPEKSRPWQQPPKLSNLLDVANYYVSLISSPDMLDDLLDALDTPIALSVTAQAMMMGNVSNGVHSLDSGILVMPVIIEMLQTVAMVNDIKFTMYTDDNEKKAILSNRDARMLVDKAMKKIEQGKEPATDEVEPAPAKEVKGLMTKRKEVV
jgi:hypothetical protein